MQNDHQTRLEKKLECFPLLTAALEDKMPTIFPVACNRWLRVQRPENWLTTVSEDADRVKIRTQMEKLAKKWFGDDIFAKTQTGRGYKVFEKETTI
jgi:hypothetical protein